MTDTLDRLTRALRDRYRIERELGQGGMATVYLAEDLRHQRRVALKVLRPELAAVLGADRFVQEITTTASLQHPHILALFDSGEADGFLFYVMPFIEGETLRQQLDRERQLGIDEAIRLTTDIADALDYAHRQGVIHRDIKPENILLQDGRPMVADFGIALAVSAAAGGRMTETGLSLGTPHYMSPEQATAEKDLTGRSDVYSLGAVLYEMLTGDPPHIGGTAQQIIMKIVTEDAAPVTRARKSVPPHVAAAVATALEKLPADRFASATEFARALRTPTYARSGLGGATAADRPRSRTAFALPAVTAVLFLAAVAGWLRPRAGDQPDLPVIRSTIALPDSAPITVVGEAPFGVGHAAVVLSPDDEHLVYVAEAGGRARLYRRRLDEFDVHPLPGTEGAYGPFFSPDGAWVGFLSTNRLRKVPIAGGAVVDLATAPNTFGATWGDDGRIYFAPNEGRTISWVAEDGGEVRDLTRATSAQIMIGWPQKVQGEPWLVVMPLAGETVAVSTETGEQVTLGQRLPHPRVAGSALLYTEQTTVMAMPFDPARAAVTGSAVPVLSGVRTEAVFRVGQYAVSPAGTLVYLPGSSGDVGELTWVHPSGAVEMLPYPAQRFSALELAPGGDRLAIVEHDVQDHIWLYDFPRAERRRLSTAGTNMSPIWTPDGSRVTWASVEGAEYRIVQRTASGGVEPEVLYASERAILPSSWSPDGRVLLAFEFSAKGGYPDYDIVVLSPEDGTVEPFVDDPYNTWSPSFSPDGRFVAYTSDESGEYEVWVEPFPRTGERWQVSTGGGNEEPIWSHRGDRLYFRGGTRWYGTAVSWTGGFGFETPREVFRGPYMNAPGFSYDVGPDGAALVLRDAGQRRATGLTLVTNWLATITAEAGG